MGEMALKLPRSNPVNLEFRDANVKFVFDVLGRSSGMNFILDKDVRPYTELDAGGVELLNLIEDKEVIIAYQGTCTSCHSATGATLSYIQQVLKAKVHPDIFVTPNL